MARLSAGERLMTRIRRLIMVPPSSGPCRCTAGAAAGSHLAGSGRQKWFRSVRGTRAFSPGRGLMARSRVSVAGMVRPVDVWWPA